MKRALLILCVLAVAAAVRGVEGGAPLHPRPLTFDAPVEAPRPEAAAAADPRFLAAAKVARIRHLTTIAAALLAVVTLVALYFSPLARVLSRRKPQSHFGATLAAAALVGATAFFWAAAGQVVLHFTARGLEPARSLPPALIPPVLWGVAATALTLAAACTRARWPQLWWLALTCAAVAAWVAGGLLRPWPPIGTSVAPAGSPLGVAAAYLAAEKELPLREVRVREGAAAGGIRAEAMHGGRDIVATAAAAKLDRYEAEVLLATAYARSAAIRKSLLLPAALIIYMAALVIADAGSAWITKKSKRGPHPTSAAFAFAALFALCFLATLPALNTWSRQILLKADGEAVRKTRLPLAAVALYYGEARANLIPPQPDPILHAVADAEPSPAARAAAARRLRYELAE